MNAFPSLGILLISATVGVSVVMDLPAAQAAPAAQLRFQSSSLDDNAQGPYAQPSASATRAASAQTRSARETNTRRRRQQQATGGETTPRATPSSAAPAPASTSASTSTSTSTPPGSAPQSADSATSSANTSTPQQTRPPNPATQQSSTTQGARPATSASTNGRRPGANERPSQSSNAGGVVSREAVDYVLDTYAQNGVALDGRGQLSVVELYRAVQQRGSIYHGKTPIAGDLVFFHNTHDANRDRRNNDWYTHVGVVEQVHSDGTIVVISWRANAVQRDTMNLQHPRESERGGRVINTPLRAYTPQDVEFTQYLSGELFAGFGSMLGEIDAVLILDRWAP